MNRLHPLSAVSKGISTAMTAAFLPALAIVFLSDPVEQVDAAWLFVVAPLGFLAGLAYGVAYYYRFEYELTADTFDVASGVFSRQSREIPYRRIQNVDVRQDLLQRLFGLAVVSVETAGGGDSEATLSFVAEDEADRIQAEVRRLTAKSEASRGTAESGAADSESTTAAGTGASGASSASGASADSSDSSRDASSAADSPDGATDSTTAPASAGAGASAGARPKPERTRLFELEFRELLLYAATAVRLSAAILPVILVAFIGDPSAGMLPDAVQALSLFAQFVAVVLPWAIATYVFSAAFTISQYYDFRLDRAGNDFVYEHGLVQRYSGSIPVEKVQSLTITDNPLQRQFGYAGLWVETAGYGPDSDSGRQATIPFAGDARIYRFVEGIAGLERPQFSALPEIARRRYLARYAGLATLLVVAAFGLAQVTAVGALEYWYLSVLAYGAVPVAAHLKWVNMGYYVGEDHLVIRRGFWRRETTVIPYFRIQTVNTRQSLLQRRLGLASVVVDTASSRTFSQSTPTIDDIDLADARDVHEASRQRLQRTLRERRRDAEDAVGLSASLE